MKLELALSIASGQSGKIASRIALKSCLNHFQKKNLNDAILANPLDYKLELSFSLTHHNKVGACLMAKYPMSNSVLILSKLLEKLIKKLFSAYPIKMMSMEISPLYRYGVLKGLVLKQYTLIINCI